MAELSRRTSETGGPSVTAMPDDVEKGSNREEPTELIDEAERNYDPKTLKFWSVLCSIYLALFIVALDRTIIGTATPQITQEFNSLGDIGWYGSAYQLTTAGSQLVFGRVYKFYEVKKTFLVVVLLFEIGSVVCGAAPNSTAFIFGRAIAGLGGAGIFTGVMIIMLSMVPLRKRPVFQGIFGAVFGIASVMGPLIGGAFTTRVTWRWCFYINLPIGAAAAFALLIANIPSKKSTPARPWEHITRLDPLGTIVFVPSIVCLLLALQWGGSTYEWRNWRIILLLVLFGVLFIAFGAVQVLRPETATVPVRVITQRSIAAASLFMLSISGAMMMTIYYMPFWFQVVQGVSAVQSGINTLAIVLSLVVASIIAGGSTQKLGYYVPVMILCPAILAVGQGLLSTIRVDEDSPHWIGYEIIVGFGMGLGMQSAGLAAQAVLPKPDIPTGVSIMFFCQQLGGGVFTSVGQNLLTSYMVEHAYEVPGLDPKQITTQGATDLVSNVPPEQRAGVKQLYNESITRIFICGMGVALVAFVASFFMEWKNIKKTGPPSQPEVDATAESRENELTSSEGHQTSITYDGSDSTQRRSIQIGKDERISHDVQQDQPQAHSDLKITEQPVVQKVE
ncbi:MFS general substrate transporter [Hypomontagnella monticulosa]|nr:MFS general substrate transporter [Hypomontagnella monticulosa]